MRSSPFNTEIHLHNIQTLGLRCFRLCLHHEPCGNGCLYCQQRHTQTHKPEQHSCSLKAGIERTQTHTRASKLYTQWHYYPLGLDAKMSPGSPCGCVCISSLCMLTDDMGKTDTTHARSTDSKFHRQDQTFMNADSKLRTQHFFMVTFSHKVMAEHLQWKICFHVIVWMTCQMHY